MTYTLTNKNLSISEEELQDLIRQRDSRPKIGDKFWSITTQGQILYRIYNDTTHQRGILEVGNFFSSEEEAKKEVARRKARAKIAAFVKEHNLAYDSSRKHITKWYPCLNTSNNRLFYHHCFSDQNVGAAFYFNSNDDAARAIEGCQEEWRTLLGD